MKKAQVFSIIFLIWCKGSITLEAQTGSPHFTVTSEGRQQISDNTQINETPSVQRPVMDPDRLKLLQEKDLDKKSGWYSIVSAADLCTAYPDRVKTLFGEINLDLPGLKQVKTSFEKGNLVKACELLLDYYKKGNTASWLRKELPASSDSKVTLADSAVLNIYSFYNQPFQVLRDSFGHLDWSCHGPTDDIEWAWALNRHYPVSTLFNAYLKTGNRKYSKTIDKDIKDWIICSLPYPGVKSSTEMWRGLEVSFRVKAWSTVFFGLMKSEDLSPATRLLILTSLPEHAHYARNFHAQGNWLTMELSGLATVATSWPEFKESASWLKYSGEAMTESLKEQVYPDGAQTELTSSYHIVALNNFSLFMDICKQAKTPVPELFRDQIEKMWNYTAYTNKPDGFGLLNNDADLMFNSERIIRAAEQFGRKDWLYIATNGKEGTKPEGNPSVIFPWAGHFIMRSGFDKEAHFGFFDIGPWGTGHQHNDKLHLSVSAFGHDFLVDGGRFAYKGEVANTFRRYALGSHSHNIVIPDGKLQSSYQARATVQVDSSDYRISEDYDFASGSFDRYSGLEGTFVHNRSVLYIKGLFWVVVDHFTTDRPRNLETLWHWHPNCKVSVENDKVVADNGGGILTLTPVGPVPMKPRLVRGQMEPFPQGWYSEEYNIALPSTATIFSESINGNTYTVWLLYPLKGSPAYASARITGENDKSVSLEVKIDGKGLWKLTVPFTGTAGLADSFIPSK